MAVILALTVLLKLVFLPLVNKLYPSMSKMKELQSKIEALKSQYGKDTAGLNQAIMELYKREIVNPMGAFFFAMYKVLFISIKVRHEPVWGWIKDLSTPHPENVFTLFGLIPGLIIFLQQRMNPVTTDPVQEKCS